MPNLTSYFDDDVRVEQQFAQHGGKWRAYKKDDDGVFQIVSEHDDEDAAIDAAKKLGG